MRPFLFSIFVKKKKMINSVRNTVLSVLNKNNYGYISPSDFNFYAKQAQMEIYEDYFSNYNKAIVYENQRVYGTDYANIEKPIAEVLESFLVQQFLFPAPTAPGVYVNRFFVPSDITTGNRSYMISKILYYPVIITSGVNTSFAILNSLEDATATFQSDGISIGDIVTNNSTNQSATVVSIFSQTIILLDSNIFSAVGDSYNVLRASSVAEAERVTDGKITALSLSPLTSPSQMFPAYTLSDLYLFTYPSLNQYGAVRASYFRYPKDPKWTYVTLINGEPAFDQTQPDYQDFELPLEDEYKLVMKILQYCGISIREYQVTQFGIAQEGKSTADS
jgi:hypothetical protein